MKVSRLINDDWTFGRGNADYIKDEKAIYQNALTRLRSFKNDWFLDIDAHIDWISLLGSRDKKAEIMREIERVILNTEGVTTITKLEVIEILNRQLRVAVSFNTVFGNELQINEQIS
jgi:hypothetical protein